MNTTAPLRLATIKLSLQILLLVGSSRLLAQNGLRRPEASNVELTKLPTFVWLACLTVGFVLM